MGGTLQRKVNLVCVYVWVCVVSERVEVQRSRLLWHKRQLSQCHHQWEQQLAFQYCQPKPSLGIAYPMAGASRAQVTKHKSHYMHSWGATFSLPSLAVVSLEASRDIREDSS